MEDTRRITDAQPASYPAPSSLLLSSGPAFDNHVRVARIDHALIRTDPTEWRIRRIDEDGSD